MLADLDPADFALIWTLILNVAVLASAYRFARARMTRDRAQGALDAALIWYATQYVAVGLPGLLGILRAVWISATALLIAALLWFFARPPQKTEPDQQPLSASTNWVALAAAIFGFAYVAAFIYNMRSDQITFNDALTYHMPAAVQWLQRRRLGLFQAWFYNPANTYSPLGGSLFITWLIAPFHNDILARFVEAPALLVVGLALYQLCHELDIDAGTAAIIAAAGILSRGFFFQSMMAKDDLFVAAFCTMALVAMSPRRAEEPLAPWRLGLAVGLLLAMKYTALFNVPILLLAIDGPWKARWRWRWLLAATVAALIAGPWYLRNALLSGNPFYPIDIKILGLHVAHGLFTAADDPTLHTAHGALEALSGRTAMPAALLVFWVVAAIAAWLKRRRSTFAEPLTRAVVLGPVVGIALFLWRAPFAEPRFVLPSFILMFATCAVAIEAWLRPPWARWIAAIALLALSITTVAVSYTADQIAFLVTIAATAAGAGVAAAWLTRSWPAKRRIGVAASIVAPLALILWYVDWAAYAFAYEQSTLIAGSPVALSYPRETLLWRFVQEHVPADATMAYTNMHLIYPMQGFHLDRRLVYAPTRPGVRTIAGLPTLATPLTGDALTDAIVKETVTGADRAAWIANLRASGATYLVIGKSRFLPQPPEIRFAAEDPTRFHKRFDADAGNVYEMDWGSN